MEEHDNENDDIIDNDGGGADEQWKNWIDSHTFLKNEIQTFLCVCEVPDSHELKTVKS